MSLEKLVSKYVASADYVFDQIGMIPPEPVSMTSDNVSKVIEHAKAYLEDAKYYRKKEKLEVSLASVAYCEGLLDAIRLLRAVKFEWPTRKKERT